ncbi:MAG: hypothetical protein ACXWC9_10605 [Pseudobdellovibrionaceae bacterium]
MSANLKNSHFLDHNVDSLGTLEMQLKEHWSQYIRYVDQNGIDEKAKALKSRYFQLYQHYQRNKNWRKANTSN